MKPVLLVDDSPTMLTSISNVLKKAGIASASAISGEAAVDLVNGGLAPCLIITDYHMPGMHGVDLIGRLRRMAATRFVPMLILTTDSDGSKRQSARAAGATGWIVKPVEPSALIQLVKQLVPAL
jgi:two-component system chemotaxis response regulator CheY